MVNRIVLPRLSLHFHLSNLFVLEFMQRLTHKIFYLSLISPSFIPIIAFFTTFITSLFFSF